jgi:hypothetical protein
MANCNSSQLAPPLLTIPYSLLALPTGPQLASLSPTLRLVAGAFTAQKRTDAYFAYEFRKMERRRIAPVA